MSKPQSNGLVELVDEKQDMDSSSWHCMDFWNYNHNEADKSLKTRKHDSQRAISLIGLAYGFLRLKKKKNIK